MLRRERGAERTARLVSAWAVFVLLVAYTLAFIDRQIISLLVEPLKRDLALSDTAVSLLQGLAFAVLYATLGLPIARLSDRLDRRWVIATGIAFWSAMTAACGLATSYVQLLLARIGVGAGEAALTPAAYSLLADHYRGGGLARALSVYNSGIYIGGGLAFIFGGLIVGAVSAGGPADWPVVGQVAPWQQAFLVVALPGIPVALLALTMRDPTRGAASAPLLSSNERVMIELVARRRFYIPHFLGFALLIHVGATQFAWYPTFFARTYALEPAQIGLGFGLGVLVGGLAGLAAGGYAADRAVRRGYADGMVRTGILAAALTVPVAALTPLMPSAGLAFAGAGLLNALVAAPVGGASAALQLAAPPALRARVSAVYLFVITVFGFGLGPTSVALVTDQVFDDEGALRYSLAIVGAVAAALSCVALIRCGRELRRSASTSRSRESRGPM